MGKGDWRRPAQVEPSKFESEWDRIFQPKDKPESKEQTNERRDQQ